MKLLRMTATFGRLDHETLTLQEGLNLIELPNEGGKSTWTEFLLAMLYGIDTSEREKAGVLPIKTKYQPWCGKPMEGTLELLHQGQRITITRTSTARAPLGTFSAVYTDSGLPVEGLSAQNCGEKLLGVPKSVYARSAFVRQLGLAVSADDALERRLSALVTTGDETVSFSAAAKRLREQQNRIRHNKTGLIPDAERELALVDDALGQLAAEHEKNLHLHAQLQQLTARQAQCRQTLKDLAAYDAQQKQAQLYETRRASLLAANRENAAAASVARLPQEQTLLTLSQAADTILRTPAAQPPEAAPAKPVCPDAFVGVDEEKLMAQAQRDMHAFDRLTARRYRPAALFFVLCALMLCAAAIFLFVRPALYGALGCAAAGLVCLILALLAIRSNKKREQELTAAQALLTRYGGCSRDEFAVCAADYRQELQLWQAEAKKAADARAAFDASQRHLAEQTAALLGSVRMFAPADSPAQAQTAIADALAAYNAYHAAQAAAQQARSRYDALRQALGDPAEGGEPATLPAPQMTKQQADAALAATQTALAATQSQLDQSRGRLQSLGGEDTLTARKEQLLEQLQTLTGRQQALELAARTLEQVNDTLTARFSPRLVQEASDIFSQLTGGRYQTVHADRQMNLAAGQADDAMRRLLSLSCGTADQLYLSVRLAISRLLLPPDAPIILDDALAMFDDARLRLALDVLQQEAAVRQILLFTCQSRERQALAENQR